MSMLDVAIAQDPSFVPPTAFQLMTMGYIGKRMPNGMRYFDAGLVSMFGQSLIVEICREFRLFRAAYALHAALEGPK